MSSIALATMNQEQRAHLAGLAADILRWLLIYGAEDHNIALGAFNALNLCGYWVELRQSPRWIELEVWSHGEVSLSADKNTVRLHPSVLGKPADTSAPSVYRHRETYETDGYAGTRLAAHASLALLVRAAEGA